MDFISTYVQPFGVLLAVGLSLWNLIQSPSTKNAGDIQKVRTDLGAEVEKTRAEIKLVDDKVDTVGGRVSTLETVMKHMPDKGDLHRLELSLERMSGHIETLGAKLEGVEHLSRRVQAMLTTSGGKES